MQNKIHIETANVSVHDDSAIQLMENVNTTIKVKRRTGGDTVRTHAVSTDRARMDQSTSLGDDTPLMAVTFSNSTAMDKKFSLREAI
jgi:hypothetical protein